MIAHLGMYDLPPLQKHNDIFWQAIRHYLGSGPQRLTRRGDFDKIWQDRDLVLAQTCGYPYRDHLHRMVKLVGTLDYGLPDCAPGYYFSVLVAHRMDPRRHLADFNDARLAYNEALSQSGWAAPILHLSAHGMRPGALLETGSHHDSARAVVKGQADIAGLDAMTFYLLREHDPGLMTRLQVVGHTQPTPGLPLITSVNGDVVLLRRAISRAIEALPQDTRSALHIRGLTQVSQAHYLAVPNPPSPAEIMR